MTEPQSPIVDISELAKQVNRLVSAEEKTREVISTLNRLMTGNGDPTHGYIIRFDRLEQFLRDELGYGTDDKSKRLSTRIGRIENIIFPIIALVTPVSIWAVIEIVKFLEAALFHTTGGIVIPTPHP